MGKLLRDPRSLFGACLMPITARLTCRLVRENVLSLWCPESSRNCGKRTAHPPPVVQPKNASFHASFFPCVLVSAPNIGNLSDGGNWSRKAATKARTAETRSASTKGNKHKNCSPLLAISKIANVI